LKIQQPTSFDPSQYYTSYLSLISGDDLITAMEKVSHKTLKLTNKLKDEDFQYRYGEGKWTVGVLLQHICDAERVYAYRALRFLRGDLSELPGFDENDFADGSKGYSKISEFTSEYHAIRSSSLSLFLNSHLENLDVEGSANGIQFSPRVLGWLMVGHNLHHLHIFEERYLPGLK
jgi:uncharacterized damage-inducible protein DinB